MAYPEVLPDERLSPEQLEAIKNKPLMNTASFNHSYVDKWLLIREVELLWAELQNQ